MKKIAGLFAVFCICLPNVLGAQEAGDESADGFAVGTPVVRQVGEIYTRAVHGDWIINCIYSGAETEECNMQQFVTDKEGNRIARVEVFEVPDVAYLGAGANITTPLGTLLESGLVLAVGRAAAKTYPFRFCLDNGCAARIAFTTAEVELLRKSISVLLTIRSVYRPEEPTSGALSLAGFTAGFAEVQIASGTLKE